MKTSLRAVASEPPELARLFCLCVLVYGLTSCHGRASMAAAPMPTDGASAESDTPVEDAAAAEPTLPPSMPPARGPAVLGGTYVVKGAVKVTLANPARRFPDKNPKQAAPLTGEIAAKVARLEKALRAATWQFAPDGSLSVYWADPFVNRAIEMTGTWESLFGQFDVSVKNPEITVTLSDGSPNAPMSLRGAATKLENGNLLRMPAMNLFYAPPDEPSFTGQCRFELTPPRD